MNRIAFVVAVLVSGLVSSEAYAQNGLLGRLFRSRRPAITQYSTPVFQQSYQPARQFQYSSPSYSSRVPQPVTGYGSNLHRNYMIRRAQQRALTTGIEPRNTGNIYWAR